MILKGCGELYQQDRWNCFPDCLSEFELGMLQIMRPKLFIQMGFWLDVFIFFGLIGCLGLSKFYMMGEQLKIIVALIVLYGT